MVQLVVNKGREYATDGIARYEVCSRGVLWFAIQHRRMLRAAFISMKLRIGKRTGKNTWELIQGI